jgi:hypothetical protein
MFRKNGVSSLIKNRKGSRETSLSVLFSAGHAVALRTAEPAGVARPRKSGLCGRLAAGSRIRPQDGLTSGRLNHTIDSIDRFKRVSDFLEHGEVVW